MFVSGTIGLQPSVAKVEKKPEPQPTVTPPSFEPAETESTPEADKTAETAEVAEPADDQPLVGTAEKETRQK